MTAQELKNSILQLAIQGKLVKQDPNDEPASVLLEKIKEEREKLIKEKKIKKEKYSEIYKNESDNHYYEKFEDGTIKDITDEIPFEIPSSWCWTRMKNLLSVKGGKRIPKGKKLLDMPTKHIYIRVTDMKNNTIDSSKIKYISNEVYEQIKNYTISSDDLYLTIAGTIGSVGIIPKEFNNMNLTENAVKLCNLLTNKELLLYFIQSQFIQNQFVDKTNKVAQPKLAIVRIESTLIPLPPKSEQERIISKLVLLLPYIKIYSEKNKQLEELNNSYKEELKKSILQYAIQGKLVPQDANDESSDIFIQNILNEKRKLIKEKHIKKENLSIIYKDSTDNQFYEKFDDGTIINITDEIPFDIPENWAWTRLYNILEIARGGSPRPIQAYLTETDNGVNWIKIGDTEKGGKYINSTKEKIIPEGMKKSRFVKKGDFILSNSMSFGRPYILNIDGCIHDGWLVFSNVDTCFFKDYLYYLLSSNFVYSQFCSRVSGAVVNNLNSDKVKNTLIPLSPLTEQKQIALSIESFFNILADT